MSSKVFTYDPKLVTFTYAGLIISGYADGTFIHLERNADMWALKMGADGIGTRAKSNDRSAKITLTLQQSSSVNDQLSALASADELTNSGAAPWLLRDASGRTLCSALTAWIVKYPGFDFAKEVTDRAWIFETNDAEVFIGGN